MSDSKLDSLIKEKMQKYVPNRPVQVFHGGVIVLVSIAIGVLNLPSGQEPAGASLGVVRQGLGVFLAAAGLALYVMWTYLRADKARKEANAEFLVAFPKKAKGK